MGGFLTCEMRKVAKVQPNCAKKNGQVTAFLS